MSELLALGVSHKTAPLDLRERLSLTEGRAAGALRELTEVAGIHEAAAISTCNRTELYLIVSDPVEAESTALGVLTRQAEIRPTELLGQDGLGRISMDDGDAVDGAIVLKQVDTTPVPQGGHQQLGQMLELGGGIKG